MQRCVALRHVSLGGCRKLGDVAVGVNGVGGYCTLTSPSPLYFDLRAIRGTTGHALAYTSASQQDSARQRTLDRAHVLPVGTVARPSGVGWVRCAALGGTYWGHVPVSATAGNAASTRLGAALEYIDLEQCTALTDAGIHALLAGCRRLSIMRLSGCDNVSASAVALVQSMGLKTKIGQHDEIVLDYLSLLRAR